MRKRTVIAVVLASLLAAPLAGQQSSLSFSEVSYLTAAQLVKIDLFVKGFGADGLNVVGSAQFRNESDGGYCARIVIATFDANANLTALGSTAPVCVNAGVGNATMRTLRIETTLQPVADPPSGAAMRLVAKAIADPSFELNVETVRRLFGSGYDAQPRRQQQRLPQQPQRSPPPPRTP